MSRCRVAAIALACTGLGACGGARISKPDAASAIQSSSAFKTSKLAYVPRVLAIPADGSNSPSSREGQALTIVQIAVVDPVVALLRARDQVEIEDFVSAVESSIIAPPRPKPDSVENDSTKTDSTKTDSTKTKQDSTIRKPQPKPINQPMTSPPPSPPLAQQWVHTLRVTPRTRSEMADLVPDDGSDNEDAPRPVYNGRRVGRIPGWTLPLGTREFIRVLDVADRTPARSGVPGEIVVDFLWRWRPTRAGALFDVDGAEFQSLPTELQQAVQGSKLILDTSSPQWSRATLTRTSSGWRVSLVEWDYGDGRPHEPW